MTDGSSVWACHDDGQILDALRAGQLALFVAVDRLAADVDAEVRAFDPERAAFVAQLQRSRRGFGERLNRRAGYGTASASGAGRAVVATG